MQLEAVGSINQKNGGSYEGFHKNEKESLMLATRRCKRKRQLKLKLKMEMRMRMKRVVEG